AAGAWIRHGSMRLRLRRRQGSSALLRLRGGRSECAERLSSYRTRIQYYGANASSGASFQRTEAVLTTGALSGSQRRVVGRAVTEPRLLNGSIQQEGCAIDLCIPHTRNRGRHPVGGFRSDISRN